MNARRSELIASLQSTIRRMEGKPTRRGHPRAPAVLSTGIAPLDALIGGWPRPGVTEIAGPAGSGRFSLTLPALGALTRDGRPVAIVDPYEVLNPPGLPELRLERLLVVRPGPEPRGAWAAEQLLASGVFPLVVGLELPGAVRGAQKLRQAATRGGSALVLIARWSEPRVPAGLRLEVTGRGPNGISLTVSRQRGGRGGDLQIPPGLIAPGMIR